MINEEKRGERQKSKTLHSWIARREMVEIETYWGGKSLGKLPAQECKLSCSLSVSSYLWALGLRSADCCSLDLHQSQGPSAEEEIHSRRDYHRPGAFCCSSRAHSEGRSRFKDNNGMTALRHSDLAVTNWSLWTVIQQLGCVLLCGWSGRRPEPWVSPLRDSIPVSQKNNLPTPPC